MSASTSAFDRISFAYRFCRTNGLRSPYSSRRCRKTYNYIRAPYRSWDLPASGWDVNEVPNLLRSLKLCPDENTFVAVIFACHLAESSNYSRTACPGLQTRTGMRMKWWMVPSSHLQVLRALSGKIFMSKRFLTKPWELSDWSFEAVDG
jgi:hypothetical protein